MHKYIIRRLLLFIPALLGVTIIIFVLMRVVGGDPAIMILGGAGGEGTYTQADLTVLRQKLSLDRPLPIQYLEWLWGVVRLDMGRALFTGRPVIQELAERFPLTFELAILSVLISGGLSIPMGLISALRQDTWIDYLFRAFSIAGLAMPSFWVGTLTILVLSRYFNWFPPLGIVYFWEDPSANFQQMIWPALGLGYYFNALMSRMTRSQMLEVIREDYIRTAWAKGLRERVIILRHALKNAVLPVVTLAGLEFSILLGGTVVMEIIFSVPGMGRALILAISVRDYPMVQAIIFTIATVFLTVNLMVDILYGWLDPRIRYQ